MRLVTAVAFFLISNTVLSQTWTITTNELIFSNPPFQQCHASTLVETSKGELLAAWFGGSREGGNDVSIWSSTLKNGIWSAPVTLADGKVDSTLSYPLWNPVLFKSSKGTLFLFYKQGPNPREWWGMFKTSENDGKTWSAAERLPQNILGPIKNKPVELADGTLLSPSSTETLEKWKVHIERSADMGKTWQLVPVDPDSEFNVIQPSILKYPEGKLQILCRSKEGNLIESWSFDGGKTWSKLTRTTVLNPNSGTDAADLKNGYKILIYNPLTPGKEWFNGRFKLNAAVSEDGKTWTDIAVLEDGTKEEFSYPAVIQTSDSKIHITYTYDRKNIKHVIIEPGN